MDTEALRRRLPGWACDPRAWRGVLLALLQVVSWFAFSPVQFRDGDLPMDKLRHLAVFGVLAWVALQGWARAPARVAAALLAYGVFIELVQSRVPGRHASAADVLADVAGIALGLLAARVFSVVR
ncbi:MAG: VanZ family protein [Rubrivivax sp.]